MTTQVKIITTTTRVQLQQPTIVRVRAASSEVRTSIIGIPGSAAQPDRIDGGTY